MTLQVERCTIFVTLAGSQAHGTARSGSDVDLRGVCVVPLPARLSLFSSFEQYEGPLPIELQQQVELRLREHPTASAGLGVKSECVIYDIAKFIGLCANANPNALEILFADERDWLIDSPAWRLLHSERHQFLTRKVQQTFLGYAMAQLKKIKTHRGWLLNPPGVKPTREEFGLPTASGTTSHDVQNRIEQSIAEKLRSYGIDDIEMARATRLAVQERLDTLRRDVLSVSTGDVEERMRAVATCALSIPSDVVATLNAEMKYRAAMSRWHSYQVWKSERNHARAALEREHGYDTKHAMHLIRLMRMGLEILERGEFFVRRMDAAELSEIRDGSMTFDELVGTAASLQAKLGQLAANTTLPDDVDRERVEQLAVQLMLRTAE